MSKSRGTRTCEVALRTTSRANRISGKVVSPFRCPEERGADLVYIYVENLLPQNQFCSFMPYSDREESSFPGVIWRGASVNNGRRNAMWPFEPNNQQMYQQYATHWDQGTYDQIPDKPEDLNATNVVYRQSRFCLSPRQPSPCSIRPCPSDP